MNQKQFDLLSGQVYALQAVLSAMIEMLPNPHLARIAINHVAEGIVERVDNGSVSTNFVDGFKEAIEAVTPSI